MFGILNNHEIEELIQQQLVGRIGCHAEGITYVVPVSYAYDGKYIYGHSYEGMKINMMRKNPHICFQVDDLHNMANWRSVIASGEYEELKDATARNYALQQLIRRTLPLVHSETMHLSPQWPFPTRELDEIDGIAFRIELKNKSGRFEKSPGGSFFAT